MTNDCSVYVIGSEGWPYIKVGVSRNMMKIETLKASYPITCANLPQGPWWEPDGACWKYIREGEGFRWQPQNLLAFAKSDGPEDDMSPFAPPQL